jgi:hypothetical protein
VCVYECVSQKIKIVKKKNKVSICRYLLARKVGLITSSKITFSKVIKLIEKLVVDHFVERYLWYFGVLPMAYYLWLPRPVGVRIS